MDIKRDMIRTVHCTGVGGIGMSALARFFLHAGTRVTGSDSSPSDITEALASEGVEMLPRESGDNITSSHDLLVYTPATSDDHPERVAAREKGVPTLSYPEALGYISQGMTVIAVAGTHGKSTTTAMIAHILEDAGLDPTVIVGSLLFKRDGKPRSNFRPGKSDYFVVEACEYKRSFATISPDVLVVTNIDEDHLDYYRDLEDIQNAFSELARHVSSDGTLVCDMSSETVRPITGSVSGEVVDYMTVELGNDTLSVPGEHNRNNARAAVAAASVYTGSTSGAVSSLRTFTGIWRRLEHKGETKKGALVFDDYAHHPREISATLSALRERFPDKRLVVVYQPHLGSRTDAFFDEFVESLEGADHTVLAPIYKARAENEGVRSSSDIAEALAERGKSSVSVSSLDEAVSCVSEYAGSEAVIVMMGAGDIYMKTPALVERVG